MSPVQEHSHPSALAPGSRIAVIGSGIAGLTTAHLLSERYQVTVFEAEDRLGGHTATKDVQVDGQDYTIDTGFIVFNQKTYPNFLALLGELGVAYQDSDMSFAVRHEGSGLEYNGTSINALFAQRSNLLRPSFWRMVRDIPRFYSSAKELLEPGAPEVTLGDYLRQGGYSKEFVEWHMQPMTAAVWSATRDGVDRFPARFLVEFFENHGFLQVDDRPQWYVLKGGSRSYLEPLSQRFRERIHLGTPVQGIERSDQGVELRLAAGRTGGRTESFDGVVLATHSDISLRILGSAASDRERSVLGDLAYQPNEVILHTDESLLPKRKLARASWNVHLTEQPRELAAVTYWMNLLQGLPTDGSIPQFCVTLNYGEAIDPQKVLGRFTYDHPVYTPTAVAAQAQHGQLNGRRRTWYAGAYWGYGFHEDGVNSAHTVARSLGVTSDQRATVEA